MIGPVQAIGYNDPTMPSPGRGNALVMQSGGPTPVINQSLAGVVREAMEHRQFGELYGAVHGLEGVLGENFLDLRRQSKAAWSRVARTPGAALGSARRKLQPEEVPAVLRTLAERGITYFFPIGGNDSAETAHTLEAAARASGQPLTVIAVPKTVDNDLPETPSPWPKRRPSPSSRSWGATPAGWRPHRSWGDGRSATHPTCCACRRGSSTRAAFWEAWRRPTGAGASLWPS